MRMGTRAAVRVSCDDADGDAVTITLDDLARGAVLGFAPIAALEPWEDPERTRVVAGSYRPDAGFSGFDTIRARASDGRGGSASSDAVLAVRPAGFNSAPGCDSSQSALVLVAGGEGEYRERCRDREGDPVSLAVTAPPSLAFSRFDREGDVLAATVRATAGATPGWHALTVRAEDDRGASGGPMTRAVRIVAPAAAVDRTLGRGESAGAGPDELPTPARPAIVRLTTLNEGRATISASSGSAPAGYAAFGQTFEITAPAAIPQAPLQLRFRFDASLLAAAPLAQVTVFRSGTAVPACSGPGATPDPCVAARRPLRDGDGEILVRTSRTSSWSFGRALAAPAPPEGGGASSPTPIPADTAGQGGLGSDPVLQLPVLRVAGLPRLRRALANGLRVGVRSPFAGTARARLTLDARTAKRHGLRR